ncbi:MAG: A/G-specific adenine glycosylase [Siphonobacter sp.]
MTNDFFAPKLLAWYDRYGRDLPWRHTNDPYLIWLSEIILQQTRVVQGMPYYYRFVEAFPTVRALAAADEREVLRLWQGLGYYSRARNLHHTARQVVEEYNGVFPTTYEELLKLNGIGPYTAAAIASFAFNEKTAVVDGNVYRVLSRIFGIETDITTPAAKTQFTTLANELISGQQPAKYNHAIMDFGAIQCVPVSPQCMFCPFSWECAAHATGKQAQLPVKAKKTKSKERFFHYLVFERNGELALRERLQKDVWINMFDFLLIEENKLLDWERVAQNAFLKEQLPNLTLVNESQLYTHVLSHQRIQTKFWRLKLNSDIILPEGLRFYDYEEIDKLPKPVLVLKYLKDYTK